MPPTTPPAPVGCGCPADGGSLRDLLRVGPLSERVDLSAVDTRGTPCAGDLDKESAKAQMAVIGDELAVLQEQLFAEGRTGGRRRVLVVLQGMDTSGKGGAVKNVIGHVNPAGVRVTGF